MKKLIVSALMALSCGVLFATDTDMYLYWMIDSAPTFTDKDGKSIDPVDLSGYKARVATTDGSYLNLYYEAGGAMVAEGNAGLAVSDVKNLDTLAAIGGFESSTFFVELFNASTGAVDYESNHMLYSDLSGYISSMKGTAQPADTYGFKTFTAVPEPTSGLLLLLGVAGLALRRKNKKA